MLLFRRRGNQLSNGRHWTTMEVRQAREMAGTVHSKIIARKLNRTYESLRQMAKREHISLRRR